MNALPPNRNVSRIPSFTTQRLSFLEVLVIALRWGKLQMRKKNAKLLSVVVDVIIYVDNPTES